MENRSSLVRALGAFLSEFHWQVYATPTFRSPVTFALAQHSAERWLKTLGPEVYAYVAYEKGEAGGRTHCHALIGGLYEGLRQQTGLDRRQLALQVMKRAWKLGDVSAEWYDPKRGAAWYVAKFPNDGEIIGVMKRHKPHRKRRRRQGSHE